MADTSTYKPAGRSIVAIEDSARQRLKSIVLPIFKELKLTGKLDVSAINQIAEANEVNFNKLTTYLFELINLQTDTNADKIKSELKALADALVKDLSTKASVNDYTDILNKISNSINAFSDILPNVEKKIEELKLQFESTSNSLSISKSNTDSISSKTLAEQFTKQQEFISNSLLKLEKNVNKFAFKLPKLTLPKFNVFSGVGKIGSAVMKPFRALSDKINHIRDGIANVKDNMLNKLKSFSNSIKNLGTTVKNVALAPFKAIGKLFSFLNPFKSQKDKFTFDKLYTFLKKFFNIKNVAKWLLAFLKKYSKILLKHVDIIIKPIKKMLFKAVGIIADAIISAVNRILLAFAPIIIAVWAIFAAVILIGYLLYKLYKWFVNTAIPYVKDFGKKVWSGIKNIGKKILDFIKYVSYLMWIDLGTWIWKLFKKFGKWIKKTILDPILEPIKNAFNKVIDKVKNSTVYKVARRTIDDVKNLFESIKKAFDIWDSDKSFFENLKNLGGAIKDAIAEWWETSIFKEVYDKLKSWFLDMTKPIRDWWQNSELKKNYDAYIKPVVDDIKNLITKFKNTFDAIFKSWDPNKSFLENIGNMASLIKDAISEWWEKSSFKETFDNLKSWFLDMTKPIRDWWQNSELKKNYDKFILPAINDIKNLITTFKGAFDAIFKSWDPNKSFLENIGNMAEIVKNAIVNWYSTSSIKKNYDKYIKPFIADIGALSKTLKDAFGLWDSSKSIFENIKNIGGVMTKTVLDWWNNSIFKEIFEKLKNWFSDMTKPIVEWWEKSSLKTSIDNILGKFADITKPIKDWFNSLNLTEDIKKIFNDIVDLPGKVFTKIKEWFANSFWVPTFEWGDDSGSRTSIGKLFDKVAGLTFFKYYLFKGTKVKFGENANTNSDLVKTNDTVVMDNIKIDSPNTEDVSKSAPEIKNVLDGISNDITSLKLFLQPFTIATRLNFERILQKLDEKPNLLPIPFANTDAGNAALMENV